MGITKEQIEKMEAGEELDSYVAEKVMGWRRLDGGAWHPGHEFVQVGDKWKWKGGILVPHYIPRYSTDIAAAFQVVEKIRRWSLATCDDKKWTAFTIHPKADRPAQIVAQADTLPLCICRAALLTTL